MALTAERMGVLSTTCKSLRVLDLDVLSDWSAAHAKAFILPTLRRLTLRFDIRPDTPSLVQLLAAHPALTHIHLDGPLDLGDAKVVDRIFETHKTVEVFRLSRSQTRVQRHVVLAAAVRHAKSTIRRIDCPPPFAVAEPWFPNNDFIASLQQLHNLQSYHDGRIWPPHGSNGNDWSIYASWPRLEELYLHSLTGQPWSADWVALRPLSRLRALAIWTVADFSDDALVEIAAHHLLMRHFYVRGDGQLSARAWTAMTTHWPRLEALYTQLRFVDAVDLHELVRACNHLQWVWLHNAAQAMAAIAAVKHNESAMGGPLRLPLDDAWRTKMAGIIAPARIHIHLLDKNQEATWGMHPRWEGFKRPRFDDLHPASSHSKSTTRVCI
jgi:hypothetical protein